MEPDGFPERGYGNWRQYRRRLENLDVPQVAGVQCRACVDKPNACRACSQVMRDWADAHFGKAGWNDGSLADGATAAAAR